MNGFSIDESKRKKKSGEKAEERWTEGDDIAGAL